VTPKAVVPIQEMASSKTEILNQSQEPLKPVDPVQEVVKPKAVVPIQEIASSKTEVLNQSQEPLKPVDPVQEVVTPKPVVLKEPKASPKPVSKSIVSSETVGPFATMPVKSNNKIAASRSSIFKNKIRSLLGFIGGNKNIHSRFVFDGKTALGFLIAALLFGLTINSQRNNPGRERTAVMGDSAVQKPYTDIIISSKPVKENPKQTVSIEKANKKNEIKNAIPSVPVAVARPGTKNTANPKEKINTPVYTEGMDFYMVKSKAYFHNEPDASTKRNTFIVHWNKSILIPVKEENDFVYVVFTNGEGQTSRGWLKKKDLIQVYEK
jgi:hypothetical protein